MMDINLMGYSVQDMISKNIAFVYLLWFCLLCNHQQCDLLLSLLSYWTYCRFTLRLQHIPWNIFMFYTSLSFVEVKYHLNLPISFMNSSLRIVPMPVKQPENVGKYEMKFSEYNQKTSMPKKNTKKHLHVLWVILFIKSGKGIDSVTVSLHNPNGRLRAFYGDCQWPLRQRKFPTITWAHCDWGNPNPCLYQPIAKVWCHSMEGPLTVLMPLG